MLLVVDHEPETAVNADEVWLMRDGLVAAQGPSAEILRNIPLLKSCGIKALPMVDLFDAMHWPGQPLTAEGAIDFIQKRNLTQRRSLKVAGLPSTPGEGSMILEAEGLNYIYPTHDIKALRGIDLGIREGEFTAILGPNGSGKTTLAKHFNGLLKPTSGRVRVHGRPTTEYRRKELARLVGYVFQNPDHQIFCRTVHEEVGFGLKALGEAPKTIETRVAEALEVVGLQGYEQEVPFALTKGERQRVAVASVLAAQPQVLILDEPTTGLDDRHQRNMMEMLKSLNRLGHTVIIITHAMGLAAEYAGRTIVLREGSILLDGLTRAVFADEAGLVSASLRPPSLIRLSNWLGTQGLTVEQMVKELRQNKI
jgi:energy-coupling factor transport system ATP-binding protein